MSNGGMDDSKFATCGASIGVREANDLICYIGIGKGPHPVNGGGSNGLALNLRSKVF